MRGFTYNNHHYTWDWKSGYYWNDDLGKFGVKEFAFRAWDVPESAEMDRR